MKTAEELNAIKEEVEALNERLVELTNEELEQVTAGATWAYTVGVANGQPGADMKIRVRGGGSLTSNEPLIVID